MCTLQIRPFYNITFHHKSVSRFISILTRFVQKILQNTENLLNKVQNWLGMSWGNRHMINRSMSKSNCHWDLVVELLFNVQIFYTNEKNTFYKEIQRIIWKNYLEKLLLLKAIFLDSNNSDSLNEVWRICSNKMERLASMKNFSLINFRKTYQKG